MAGHEVDGTIFEIFAGADADPDDSDNRHFNSAQFALWSQAAASGRASNCKSEAAPGSEERCDLERAGELEDRDARCACGGNAGNLLASARGFARKVRF